jgi:hypothetical protein
MEIHKLTTTSGRETLWVEVLVLVVAQEGVRRNKLLGGV